jgi:hypothetical protein
VEGEAPPGSESGKLGTPLARMHLAYPSPRDAIEPELAAPPPVDAEAVAAPAFAIGLPELPPHAATRTPLRASPRRATSRASAGCMLPRA